MPNALVAAAATGLPSAIFNRRRMLLGLAAASTAAAAPVAVAAQPRECIELVGLAESTAALLAELQARSDALAHIVKEWTPRLPQVPEPIRNYSPRGAGVQNCNLVGAPRQTEWRIFPPNRFREAIEFHRKALDEVPANKRMKEKTRGQIIRAQQCALAENEAKLAMSEAYFAEFERVKLASGYEVTEARMKEARTALARHISQIMMHEPATMAGVIIQAQAMDAASSIPPIWQLIESHGSRWGERLAASILRIAGSAA